MANQHPRVLRNFALYINGDTYAGKCSVIELPKLKIKTEEHRAGGMDAPAAIDMGMELMTMKFTMRELTPGMLRRFGLFDGQGTRLLARGALQRDGERAIAAKVEMQGAYTELDLGKWEPEKLHEVEIEAALRYFKFEIGNDVMYEIDVDNMIRKIGNRDELESIRRAIGL